MAHVEIFHIVGILECEFFELVVRQVEVTDYTDKLGDFKFGKGVVMEIDVREIVLAVIAVCTGEAEAAVESVSGDYKFFEASVPLQVDRSRCVDATVHVGTGEAQVAELFERRKVDGVNFHAVEAEGCDCLVLRHINVDCAIFCLIVCHIGLFGHFGSGDSEFVQGAVAKVHFHGLGSLGRCAAHADIEGDSSG